MGVAGHWEHGKESGAFVGEMARGGQRRSVPQEHFVITSPACNRTVPFTGTAVGCSQVARLARPNFIIRMKRVELELMLT